MFDLKLINHQINVMSDSQKSRTLTPMKHFRSLGTPLHTLSKFYNVPFGF